MQGAGLDVWFKGGTSLSKGFSLIERFSEDLDLKVTASALPAVSNWKSLEKGPTAQRRAFFDALLGMKLEGLELHEDPAFTDQHLRNIGIHVIYPRTTEGLPGDVVSPHVLLEIGSARVTPSIECRITSWVHDELLAAGFDLRGNAPLVRCVHPMLTLLEKLRALEQRAEQDVKARAGGDPSMIQSDLCVTTRAPRASSAPSTRDSSRRFQTSHRPLLWRTSSCARRS